MKLTKSIASVSTALGLALCLAGSAFAQANPAPKPSQKMAAKSSAQTPVAKPAVHEPAHARVAAARPMAEKPAAIKPATAKPAPAKAVPMKPVASVAAAPAIAPPAPVDADVAAGPRRDPFVALVNDKKDSGGPILPPGEAGLVVATVRIDGTVKSGSELIAVVSNPERHVYFVRQGDQLYDGSVEKIDLEGVTFHENSKDAFGKPVVREVTKRIYASAGEQQ